MSSSLSPLATTKSVNNSLAQTSPAPQSQIGLAAGSDSHHSAQRRSGGSGSIGAGSASRGSLSSPRNNQSFRKPHKNQRKARLADEDAMAESVSYPSIIALYVHQPKTIPRTNHLSGCHEICKQPERPDFDHAFNEFFVTA
jgi:hypothetical protein